MEFVLEESWRVYMDGGWAGDSDHGQIEGLDID